MAANDYRGYLRNHTAMENGEARLHAAHSTHRPLIFGTLAVMGLLQVASSVTILLHLTGYLHEVNLSSTEPVKEAQSEHIMADALRDIRKKDKPRKKDSIPVAHLSVKTPIDFSKTDPNAVTTVYWDELRGTLNKIRYHDGRLLMEEQGLYYVYAKTCFRYAPEHATKKQDVSNVQLFQYIYHEIHTQSKMRPVLLSKSGGTLQWGKPKLQHVLACKQGRSARLKASDGIFVNVSNSRLLDPEPEGTYFGAFKMSN
ncbi:LOW QUALITY PROTEIN: tumor necrosis factor ligand superfamily member 11 [Pygocentrus nattereri]|uniref:LOW QUALITY PROTEIN: tumor necrosis factor ligand superfamily member 11 n=1 Tax=Pygocentrus nattereri TaxID=42514 RepID=UPI00189130B0|nr:LOW QUALITY PROTEIN: tumor necrosis factor ligand superfamily member 11 [Pygocentrus nattereri]